MDLISPKINLTAIADLHPATPSGSAINTVVALIWPFSASKHTISLLLVDPDVRLRRHRGQVRVELHGPLADAVQGAHISSGEEIVLELEGAEFIDNASMASTLGRGIEWDLRFRMRLSMQIRGNGILRKELDLTVTSDVPDTPVLSSSLYPSTPIGNSQLQRRRQQPNAWQSPAFTSSQSTLSFDSDLGIGIGIGRKRTKFGRRSSEWRYARVTPSPEPEPSQQDELEEWDQNHHTTPQQSSSGESPAGGSREDLTTSIPTDMPPFDLGGSDGGMLQYSGLPEVERRLNTPAQFDLHSSLEAGSSLEHFEREKKNNQPEGTIKKSAYKVQAVTSSDVSPTANRRLSPFPTTIENAPGFENTPDFSTQNHRRGSSQGPEVGYGNGLEDCPLTSPISNLGYSRTHSGRSQSWEEEDEDERSSRVSVAEQIPSPLRSELSGSDREASGNDLSEEECFLLDDELISVQSRRSLNHENIGNDDNSATPSQFMFASARQTEPIVIDSDSGSESHAAVYGEDFYSQTVDDSLAENISAPESKDQREETSDVSLTNHLIPHDAQVLEQFILPMSSPLEPTTLQGSPSSSTLPFSRRSLMPKHPESIVGGEDCEQVELDVFLPPPASQPNMGQTKEVPPQLDSQYMEQKSHPQSKHSLTFDAPNEEERQKGAEEIVGKGCELRGLEEVSETEDESESVADPDGRVEETEEVSLVPTSPLIDHAVMGQYGEPEPEMAAERSSQKRTSNTRIRKGRPRYSSREHSEDEGTQSQSTNELLDASTDEPAPDAAISAALSGFETSFSHYTPLSSLKAYYGHSVDVVAIVASVGAVHQANEGQRSWFLFFDITSPALAFGPEKGEVLPVEIYRAHKEALPPVEAGDSILLSNFQVKSKDRKFYLHSTETSSYVVFPHQTTEDITSGPPAEYGEVERGVGRGMIVWWTTRQKAINRANTKMSGKRTVGKEDGSIKGRPLVRISGTGKSITQIVGGQVAPPRDRPLTRSMAAAMQKR
ncbi:MAG: hypothetical protein M1814_002273 [Vezdaea aestivalis]|nr:MAG: hypothetical protein M1814_002273 [Vezdaea aestivalis]